MTQTRDQEVLQFSSRAGAGEILAGPLRVAELMTSETTSMSADQTFGELVTMMANRSFHHVLVGRRRQKPMRSYFGSRRAARTGALATMAQ